MLAAWLPARRAAKIPPVAAMSSVHARGDHQVAGRTEHDRRRASPRSASPGSSLGATTMSGSDGQAVDRGSARSCSLIGVIVLIPLLSRPVIAPRAPAAAGVFGVSGKLARQNAVRNPRRTGRDRLRADDRPHPGHRHDGDRRARSARPIDKMTTDNIKADYMVSMANGDSLSTDVGERRWTKSDGRHRDQRPAQRALAHRRRDRVPDAASTARPSPGDRAGPHPEDGHRLAGHARRRRRSSVDEKTAKSNGWKAGTTFTGHVRGRQEAAA